MPLSLYAPEDTFVNSRVTTWRSALGCLLQYEAYFNFEPCISVYKHTATRQTAITTNSYHDIARLTTYKITKMCPRENVVYDMRHTT